MLDRAARASSAHLTQVTRRVGARMWAFWQRTPGVAHRLPLRAARQPSRYLLPTSAMVGALVLGWGMVQPRPSNLSLDAELPAHQSIPALSAPPQPEVLPQEAGQDAAPDNVTRELGVPAPRLASPDRAHQEPSPETSPDPGQPRTTVPSDGESSPVEPGTVRAAAADRSPPAAETITTPLTSTVTSAAPEKPRLRAHTIQAGETLRQVADRYGLSLQTVLATNDLDDPDRLTVGRELVLLPTDGVLHRVQTGETLRTIAAAYAVEMTALIAANDLEPHPDLLMVDAELVVPGATARVLTPGELALAEGDAGGQVAASVPAAPVPTRVVPTTRTYAVQEGDTLRSIAATFGVDVETLLASNGLDDPDLIKPGIELRILPVKGIEHEVQQGETLADIARQYQVDLGLLLDYNELASPDRIRAGMTLVLPGASLRPAGPAPTPAEPPLPAAAPAAPALEEPATGTAAIPASAAAAPPAPTAAPENLPAVKPTAVPAPEQSVAAPAPTAPPTAVPERTSPATPATPTAQPASSAQPRTDTAPAPATPAPTPEAEHEPLPAAGTGGGTVVANAMQYLGHPYVFGGTSPGGFDCSGFVYYVHLISGTPVGRGMFQQYSGGPRIPQDQLRPGDTVFFANTYMPGLSHNGIYIGNGQFIHASDPSVGVVVSSMNSSYWSSRYVGATRLAG